MMHVHCLIRTDQAPVVDLELSAPACLATTRPIEFLHRFCCLSMRMVAKLEAKKYLVKNGWTGRSGHGR